MEKLEGMESSIKWLKTPIQYAKGVGPRLAKLFEKIGIRSFEDMLYHLPFRYLDRRELSSIHQVPLGKKQVVMGEVVAVGEVAVGRRGKKIFEVIISDGKGQISAKYFRYHRNFMKKKFSVGSKFLLFGEVNLYQGKKQMVHPEVQTIKEFFDEEEMGEFLGILPVYSSTEGLAQGKIRKVAQGVVEQMGTYLKESLPEGISKNYSLPNLCVSFKNVHHPENGISIPSLSEQKSPYHQRLAFDEFFYLHLGLGLKKQKEQVQEGFKHRPLLKLRNQFLHQLPFELTPSQVQAVESISHKMCGEHPMNALLQGDVGCGKTLVGMIASLLAIENGYQVALMVPTEILAEQHGYNFNKFLEPLGVEVRVLTASTKPNQRKKILKEIEEGKPLILIGTHSLIQEDVSFAKLSLVIIDEQHRFGVRQRMTLMKKAKRPDVLVMTATPIPRSLALTLYGDLDLILMTELPRGRVPIQTRVMTEKNRPKLYEFIRKKVEEGRQAFFVYPLIEESEKMDLKDATQGFEKLKKEFCDFKIAMIHGRMKSAEKESIMKEFSKGTLQVLVATTVIEVGIDVPNASIMVIEHAERFGLSQLHQLRGRVGRGSEKSYCILAASYRQSDVAKLRLKVMEETNDGFRIAEEDLKIRGPGDFLGTRQSGMPELRVGNLIRDLPLLEEAKKAAQEFLKRDPGLKGEEAREVRLILKHRWADRLGLAEVG